MTGKPLALVTGGSTGIGYALAQQCLRHGFSVLITGASDRVHFARQQLAADAESAYGTEGAEVIAVRSDLRTAEGVEQVWDNVQRTDRPLAVAILNAGVAVGGAFVDTDLQAEIDGAPRLRRPYGGTRLCHRW
jgi:uncharacterized protein